MPRISRPPRRAQSLPPLKVPANVGESGLKDAMPCTPYSNKANNKKINPTVRRIFKTNQHLEKIKIIKKAQDAHLILQKYPTRHSKIIPTYRKLKYGMKKKFYNSTPDTIHTKTKPNHQGSESHAGHFLKVSRNAPTRQKKTHLQPTEKSTNSSDTI